jgi:hypothetical protein
MSGYFNHQMVPKAADTKTKLTKAEMKAQIDAMRNVRDILSIFYLIHLIASPLRLQSNIKKDERLEFSVETIYRRLATIRREPYPVDLPPIIRDTNQTHSHVQNIRGQLR